MNTLNWSDIEAAAGDAFNIWMFASDLEWAKDAWGKMAHAGFCSYDTERERHVVIGRFLALASIYRDWCSVTFEETHDDMPTEWLAGLHPESIYLGQLVHDEPLSDDPDQAFDEALTFLLESERETVVRALRQVYGGTEADLFVALWRSSAADRVDEEYEDILSDATEEKLAGYAWVDAGCPNVR